MFKFLIILCVIFSSLYAEKITFIAWDGPSNSFILQRGECDKQISPMSTFKIALSLMGFDQGILLDENHPVWPYLGYDAFLESWKLDQTPKSWLTNSTIWYSRALTVQMGIETLCDYVTRFEYGNQDMSGGVTQAWLSSSLQISPRQQVLFLTKMLQHQLPISSYAVETTKSILFTEEWDNGWKLFGKTGSDLSMCAWYVGWVEKEGDLKIFALVVEEFTTLPTKQDRIARVKAELAPYLNE